MLLAQKSKPVTHGRKRRKHELASVPVPTTEALDVEETKQDKESGEYGSQLPA